MSAVLGWILIPTAGWRVFLLVVSIPAAVGAVEVRLAFHMGVSGGREGFCVCVCKVMCGWAPFLPWVWWEELRAL